MKAKTQKIGNKVESPTSTTNLKMKAKKTKPQRKLNITWLKKVLDHWYIYVITL